MGGEHLWEAVGAVGEVLGALGVIVTLGYLAVQIRQNTLAMEEGRRLALAQAYQQRADGLSMMMVEAANGPIGAIIVKLTSAGYPENIDALQTLTAEERGRFRQWQIAQQTHWDNIYQQYQQGFVDDEYYEEAFKDRLRRLIPVWRALGLTQARSSFKAEMDRLSPPA
ncbi:MAG: hypothetical protein AB7I04_23925 [Pseudomonadales bacterium]